MSVIYPWLQTAWQKMTSNVSQLHHGLMIVGNQSIGVGEFTLALAKSLLCDSTDNTTGPCHQCRSCRLFEAGTHADFHVIISEREAVDGLFPLLSQYANRYHDVEKREKRTKPSRVIAVDQIRELIDQFSTHAHLSMRKVAVIYSADRMNVNAANALLKVLEEPPADTILILVTADSGRLLPTIRSRCWHVHLPTPSDAIAKQWLLEQTKLTDKEITPALLSLGPVEALRQWENGDYLQQQQYTQGLLKVLTEQADPMTFAEKTSKQELENVLRNFQRLILSIIKTKLSQSIASDQQTLRRMFILYDKICDYQRVSRDSVNAQLAIEDIALLASRVMS